MEKIRRTSPYNIRYIYAGIGHSKQENGSVVLATLLKYLVKKCRFDLENAKLVLTNAVHDGILKTDLSSEGLLSFGRTLKNDSQYLRIPNLDEILENDQRHDWYCYECHLPGTLVFCSQCLRSFHRVCKRLDPEAPKDITYAIANHPRIVARFHVESDLDQTTEKEKNQLLRNTLLLDKLSNNAPSVENTSIILEETDKKIDILSSTLNDETKSFIPLEEVIYIGQTRSPNKPRKSTTICKNEENLIETGEENEMDWCGPCIIMKRGMWKDPPNISPEELCYLIRFLFNSIQTWLPSDTFSPLPKSRHGFPKMYLNLFKKMCLKIPTSMEDINKKIQNNSYMFLTEFLVDIQDIQHNIGVMYGINTAEYEATKFLNYNAFYEVCEIRQCPDCYRHSNEKSTSDWFCKPCKTRHELVYAKFPTYCYWPAKVIRVKNNKYDVRFFGGNHSRAIVDASCVKPIETDLASLNLKKTICLERAFKELATHQQLILTEPELYSYQSERNNRNQIETSTLAQHQGNVMKKPVHLLQKQKPRTKSRLLFDTNSSVKTMTETKTKRRSKRIGSPLNKRRATSEPYIFLDPPNNVIDTNKVRNRSKNEQTENWELVVNRLKAQMELATPENAIKIAITTFVTETNKLRGIISDLEETININKKKSWCYMCQKQALYYCCENYAYCTTVCQNKHWLNGHKENCKRANVKKNEKRRPN